MHGLARVWIKDYASKRDRQIQAGRPRPAARPNDGSGLRALARDMASWGMAPKVIHSGMSPDGPLAQQQKAEEVH